MKKNKVMSDSLFKNRLIKLLLTMKLIFFLTTIFALQISASVYSQNTILKIDFKKASVKDIMTEIERQTEMTFFYSGDVLDINQTITLKSSTMSIDDILLFVGEETGLAFTVIRDQILVTKAEKLNKKEILKQQITIKGRVVDTEGQPLPGVNILEKGTSNGTISDIDGNYNIAVSSANAILVFSYVGFLTEEIEISGHTTIDVTLVDDIMSLKEVIVVGYGTQKKSDITGAVTSLPKERLENLPNNNFTQAIQGAMPGVFIANNSSEAEGNGTSIRIRGRNSITASNSPLIILDGVPFTGSYSDINPTDIESIEILKDASSAAIYGSRGSNGVILITSKKGKAGKVRFSYNGFTGVAKIASLPHMLNGEEFYNFKTSREADELTPSEIEMYESGQWTDWIGEATRLGKKQQHTLSASGGSEKIRYYVSGTYLDVKGVAKNDDFSRFSSYANLDANLTDWLTLGSNTKIALIDRSGLPADFADAFYMNPLTKAYDDDGNLTIYPWEEDHFFDNPLQNLLAKNKNKNYSLFTNNYFDVKIPFVDGLKFRLNTGYEIGVRDEGTYYGRDTHKGNVVGGSASTRNQVQTNILVENILSYEKEIGKNRIFITGLYSFQERERENRSLTAKGFGQDVLSWYQPGVAELVSPSIGYNKEDVLSMMLRINYTYNNKYLFTATARRDGYSGFGVNSKWGTFPSIALGWNITEEDFLANFGENNTIKLRMSYGENGNQAVGAYETMARVTSNKNSYVMGNTTVPGYYPSKLGIDNLGWETTKSLNFGVDFNFLNNRIQGSLDKYTSKTEDLLLNRTISSIHGLNSIVQNIGEVQNQGIDFVLTTYTISKKDFTWSTTLTCSYLKNEIVDLYGDGSDDLANKWFIGQPITSNYDFVFDGVFQEGDDIANSAQPSAEPGFVKVKDVDENGEINDLDKQLIGHVDPNFIWGMTNTIKYKNFALDVFIQGVNGGTKANELLLDDVWPGTRRNTTFKNWWTPENPTNEHWSVDKNANITYAISQYEKTDYIRVKDVTLTYNLPTKVLQNAGIGSIQIYLTGRNLLTITDWSGLDPELADQVSIPFQKEYTAGVVVKF